MKIIHVVSDSNIGGAGKVVLNLLEACREKPVQFKVVLPAGSKLSPEIAKLQVPVIEVDGIADRSLSIKGIWELFKVLRREKPDIVHTHAGLSARIAAKLLGIKIVITRHWIGKAQKGKLLNNFLCDQAIAVSEDVAEALTAVGIPRHKITVIGNSVAIPRALSEAERQEIRSLYCITNEIAIGIAARLEEVKGHKYFLEAAAIVTKNYPNTVFLIAGTGSLENELKALAEKLRLTNVKFLGFVSDTDNFYSALDIHALASREEAFSLSILEAMSHSVPNVATRCGGITRELTQNETAFLVDYGNAQAMAEALSELIARPELRKKIGENSLQFAQEKYSLDQTADENIAIYESLVKGGR